MPIESAVQILIGVLLTISLGLIGWCLSQIVSMKGKFERHEGEHKGRDAEIDRRFCDVKQDQRSDINGLREQLTKIEGSVGAVHRRIDQFFQGGGK